MYVFYTLAGNILTIGRVRRQPRIISRSAGGVGDVIVGCRFSLSFAVESTILFHQNCRFVDCVCKLYIVYMSSKQESRTPHPSPPLPLQRLSKIILNILPFMEEVIYRYSTVLAPSQRL